MKRPMLEYEGSVHGSSYAAWNDRSPPTNSQETV